MPDTQIHNGPITQSLLTPAEPPRRPRRSWAPIALAGGAFLAALAALAVALIGGQKKSAPVVKVNPIAVYQQKLSSALIPMVAANRTLSAALQALDGSKVSIRTTKTATSNAQQTLATARGAVAIVTVPQASTQLSQQATQALTQENGYLQAVNTALGDPTGNTAASLQPLASATSSAFVPLASVASGGSTSIYGVDNLLGWTAGATAAAKHHAPPPVINNNTTVVNPTTTTALPKPSSSSSSASSGTDSQGFNFGPGCSDNPSNSLPGCADSPSIPAGDRAVQYPNGITADGQTTSEGLAESVYANYTSDGPVTGWSSERQQSYAFDCQTGGPGTTGYTICQGRAGDATLYLRWQK